MIPLAVREKRRAAMPISFGIDRRIAQAFQNALSSLYSAYSKKPALMTAPASRRNIPLT